MYLINDIAAREGDRARLATAYAEYVAAGKHIDTCGQNAGNHGGAPGHMPAGEQTQHLHRRPRKKVLVALYGERVKEAHANGWSEKGTALTLNISREEVRIVATAVGVKLPQRARAKKQPTFKELADQFEAAA